MTHHIIIFASVQFSSFSCSVMSDFATPWIATHQASLSITSSQSLPKLMSIESVMPSSHLILCRPLLLLPPILPSIRVFFSESALRMRWPKYWSFSFNISPTSEHLGLISFRMDSGICFRDYKNLINKVQIYGIYYFYVFAHLTYLSLDEKRK